MSEELNTDQLFPPAPEIASSSAASKKRAAKKAPAAKKAAVKKAPAAKKAAKKAVKTLAQAVAEMQALEARPAIPAPAPEPVVSAPEPVIAAPEPEVASAKPKAKKAARKSARKAAPEAEAEPAQVTAVTELPTVEVPAPAEPVSAPPLAVVESPVASTEAEAPAPVSPGPQEPESTAVAPAPAGDTSATGPGSDERPGRRLRWWERRKMERQARAAARAAAGNGGTPGGAPANPEQAHGQGHRDRDRDSNGRHQGNGAHRGESSAEGDDERQQPAPLGPPEPAEGLLELSPKGHGFIRLKEKGWASLPTDTFVHGDLIRKYGLREGMYLVGEARKGPRGLQLTEISNVNGRKPEELRNLPLFEELKAVNPAKRYQLETVQSRLTTRVIDMMTPVGRGQRGLIVAPPRAGKTTILQHIAEAITQNYPMVHLMILLVDERPEEVTEFKRVLPGAEIFASSNDQDTKSHARIAELAINRAKRLVEQGDHVFMLMDSITRLARAYNNMNKNGATMSGGMGVGSMEVPRRLFAAARNTRTAGSLTILATALVETGSRMDDLIFQEFKGTGNMELVLDRKIAEQYIYPAVNIFKSGTRREELLLQGFQIEKIHFLRRGLAGHKPIEAIQRVISLEERYPSNAQMLLELSSKHAG